MTVENLKDLVKKWHKHSHTIYKTRTLHAKSDNEKFMQGQEIAFQACASDLENFLKERENRG